MYKLIITCFVAGTIMVSTSSCGNDNAAATTEESTETTSTTENSATTTSTAAPGSEQAVMDVHDAAMTMNSELVNLSGSLMYALENNRNVAPETQKEMKMTISALDGAGEAMMNWMASYSVEGKSGEEKEAYLKSEMEKITAIKKQMEDAVAKGRELKGKLPKE
ncbi:MAG: hypothetical protein KDC24_01235 [Saprospiraceae bacterium]|nr:hypothetical protein [Saprospiraceae bacterium]